MLVLSFCACNKDENNIAGIAPNNVAGKVLTFGKNSPIFKYTSNSSAEVTYNYPSEVISWEVLYEKKSENSANVKITIECQFIYSSIYTENTYKRWTEYYNLTLAFADVPWGYCNGTITTSEGGSMYTYNIEDVFSLNDIY